MNILKKCFHESSKIFFNENIPLDIQGGSNFEKVA